VGCGLWAVESGKVGVPYAGCGYGVTGFDTDADGEALRMRSVDWDLVKVR
jgi:hypothetical protein